MRYIIYGVGAVGGVLAAALSRAGQSVVGIARGGMLDAIRRDGLLFRTPDGDERFHFPVVAHPSEIAFADDDVVLLTMKSQDTAEAVAALVAAGVDGQPVFCIQNGLNNERLALRHFPNVYGVTAMIPADYTLPGEVVCFGTPRHGMFDIGRYPAGRDAHSDGLVAQLEAANFAAFGLDDVMASKRGKLLQNLGNVIDAATGPEFGRGGDILEAVRAEGEAIYKASGLAWQALDSNDARRKGMVEMGAIAGAARTGSSSTQSLKRGAGSIETDYLNGEMVLLGRLAGVPAPLNAELARLGHDLVSGRVAPGSLDEAGLRRRLGLA